MYALFFYQLQFNFEFSLSYKVFVNNNCIDVVYLNKQSKRTHKIYNTQLMNLKYLCVYKIQRYFTSNYTSPTRPLSTHNESLYNVPRSILTD